MDASELREAAERLLTVFPYPCGMQEVGPQTAMDAHRVARYILATVRPDYALALPPGHDNPAGPCECGAWHTPEDFQ